MNRLLLVVLLTGSAYAQLVFSPSSLKFGKVKVGKRDTTQLVIHNTGSSEYSNLAMNYVNQSAFRLAVATSFKIAAGDSITIPVQFIPDSLGAHIGAMQFIPANKTINCSGTGALAKISLSPKVINLHEIGTLPSGKSDNLRSFSVTATNSGTDTLEITGIQAPTRYKLLNGPLKVAVGKQGVMNLQLSAPTTSQKYSDSIRVKSDGMGENTFVVNFTSVAGIKGDLLGTNSLDFGNVQKGAS